MSNSAAVEQPPHKKRKPSPIASSWFPLSSLPEEMAMSCLARVSRSDQAALSLVSKSFRSLVASPDELDRMRSVLGCTEICLYVWLLTPPDPTPRWFTLRRDKTVNRLMRIPIPSFPDQPTEAASVVALDWGIYVIGGCRKGEPRSSDVLLLDCRTHTWSRAPSMGVARASAAVGVVGGKIYVFGGFSSGDSSKWAEVFDPKTQTWEFLRPPSDRYTRDPVYIHDSVVVMGEKVYAVDGLWRTFYYSPREDKWGRVITIPSQGNQKDWCVIDKLVYAISLDGNLNWCESDRLDDEPEEVFWREVKGLGSLKESLSRSRLAHIDSLFESLWETDKIRYGIVSKIIDLLPGARLCNAGGNIVVFWDVLVEEIWDDHLEIWCAEISLETRQGPEIWGNVEWSNVVMTVDPFSDRYKDLMM